MGGCNSSTTTTLAAARCRSFTPRTCVQRSATARALDSVEQLPVPAQHRLRLREEGLALELGLRGACGARRGFGERAHGVAVLARVGRELLAGQRSCRPALVEGMAQHVPALARGVKLGPEVHVGSPLGGVDVRTLDAT